MSFSGKKYRRIRCENVEELFKKPDSDDAMVQILKGHAPIFSYERLDEERLIFHLQNDNKTYMYTFKLGEEHEMEKLDGSKLKVAFTMESDNVLMQIIKCANGKEVHFRREFSENGAEMIITMVGIDTKAKVIYEMIP